MPLNPKIVLQESAVVRGGKGLVAKETIKQGEWVWREAESVDEKSSSCGPTRPWSFAEIENMSEDVRKTFVRFAYQTGFNAMESCVEFDESPMEEWATVQPGDASMFMNHSCDPSAWFFFPDGLTTHCKLMTARRDIRPGEEVTYDYATTECHPWLDFDCMCGTSECRGRVTGNDWQREDVKVRYAAHFYEHVAIKVATHPGRWNFQKRYKKELGNYVVARKGILQSGELIMRLPPNKILTGDDLKAINTNHVLQVCWKPQLFTAALSENDFDILLAHSCEPNCRIEILEDLTVLLWSKRVIDPDEPLSFDYETTEMDMIAWGDDFYCGCGTEACRGYIVGSLRREQMEADPSSSKLGADEEVCPAEEMEEEMGAAVEDDQGSIRLMLSNIDLEDGYSLPTRN